jgi:hypothetical protein
MKPHRLRWECLILFVAVTVALGTSSFAAPSPLHRMSQLEEVKKRAAAERKPIAWIATYAACLAPYDKIKGKGSQAATQYAIRALQNDTILIYSDSGTENHQEPSIVDQELHTPDPHYTPPVVVILNPSLDKVIAKILYIPESQERVRVYTEVLKKIRDKSQWEEKPKEKGTKEQKPDAGGPGERKI